MKNSNIFLKLKLIINNNILVDVLMELKSAIRVKNINNFSLLQNISLTSAC